jgi:hypothetical protein
MSIGLVVKNVSTMLQMRNTARMNNIADIAKKHNFGGGLCPGWVGLDPRGGSEVCLPRLKSRANSSTAKQMAMTTNISNRVDMSTMK